MSIKGPYIATGSESNEVVLYSTGVSRPMLSYCLDRAGSDSDADDERRGKKGALAEQAARMTRRGGFP